MTSRIESPEVIILSTQRSGTHLLQSMLACHTQVQARGEFILHYRRKCAGGVAAPELDPAEVAGFRYRCRPGFVNLGIVMYGQIAEFEQLCGPLLAPKIIHLVRDPVQVAKSRLQMKFDRALLGDKFRAHYHTKDTAALPPVFTDPDEEALAERVRVSQSYHLQLLAGRSNVLTVTYEEICANQQVVQLSPPLAQRLFDFLELDVEAASTGLVKTSARGSGVNKLSVSEDLLV